MDTRTHRRLYSQQEMADARQAWIDADLCDQEKAEWKEWRHIAAMEGGIIVPPEGTRYDSWAVSNPSERAVICRAMREDPEALLAAIRAPGRATWGKVLAELYRRWGERRKENDLYTEQEDWQRKRDEPGKDEAKRLWASLKDMVKG